jgi:hypothetical protein
MQLNGLREQMRQHAERAAEEHRKRKEQLDERLERQKYADSNKLMPQTPVRWCWLIRAMVVDCIRLALLANLDKKQQDSQVARAKTQAQREQQAAMRKVRGTLHPNRVSDLHLVC